MDKDIYSFSEISLLSEHRNGDEEDSDDSKIVTSLDQLPEDPKAGDTAFVKFSIFRTGKWQHPWYGELNFDNEYLDGIVTNFEKGIVPRKIGYNLEHAGMQGTAGNVGWIQSLELRTGKVETPLGEIDVTFLDAETMLNSLGIELIKDRRYAYISSEIHSNYTTNERLPVTVDDEEEAETVLKHGPTLVGAAFTNHPFIPALGEMVEFNEDGPVDKDDSEFCMSEESIGGITYFSYKQNESSEEESEQEFHSVGEVELESSDELNEEEHEQTNLEEDEDIDMDFSKVREKLQSFETPQERLDYLVEQKEQADENHSVVFDTMIQAEQEAVEARQKIQKAVQRKKQYEKRAQKAAEEKAALEIELAEAREGEWEQRVKAFAADLREQGIHEPVVKTAQETLESVTAESRDMNFSLINGEDEQDVNLIDILEKCFSALPESARLDESEDLEANQEVEVDPDNKVEEFEDTDEEGDDDEGDDEELQSKIDAYKRVNDGAEPPSYILDHLNEDGTINFNSYDEASQ